MRIGPCKNAKILYLQSLAISIYLQYPFIPKGGKIIYYVREQKNMLVHFFDTLLSLKERVTFPNLAQVVIYYVYRANLNDLLLWWEHCHDNDILLVFLMNC